VQSHSCLRAVNVMLVDYTRLFCDAVDETLSLLGQGAQKRVYRFLERKYGIRREDIPTRFTDVSRILRDIFGVGGTDLVLRSIVERFYKKLDLEVPKSPEVDEVVEIVQRILSGRLELTHDAVLTVSH
jgi:hypothetical protein